MSLNRYLPFSLIAHLLLVSIAFLGLQKGRNTDVVMPKEWVIGVDVILEEKKLQLLSPVQTAGDKDSAANTAPEKSKDEVVSEPSPTPPLIKGGEGGINNELSQSQTNQIQQAFTATVNAQFLLGRLRAFFKIVRMSVRGFVSSEITDEMRLRLIGLTAQVELRYGEDGALRDVKVLSESDELRTALEKVNWHAVPLPSAYLLPYKGLGLTITVRYGNPLVAIEAL